MSLKRVGEILEGLQGLACPHCRAGGDGRTVGLVWDSREQGWRCLICGCRVYEGEVKPPPGGEEQPQRGSPPVPPYNEEGVINHLAPGVSVTADIYSPLS